MKAAHGFGRPDIDRILLADSVGLIASNKTKKLYLIVKIPQGELVLLILIQVVKTKPGKVRNKDVFWQIAFGYTWIIIQGLAVGTIEILAPRFVLNQQRSLPKQVDKTLAIP